MKLKISILLVLIASLSFGQTVQLADANLIAKLKSSYPQVMVGNELDIAKAATLTGSLDLRTANISNATGIEHFTKITTLDLTDNVLTVLPDISAITGLENIYLTRNKLTTLPDFSSLTKILDFQAMNNKLTTFPDLSNCLNLHAVYFSSNAITQFPDFSIFKELNFLIIGDNPVENEMDFSKNTTLLSLHVHAMNLTSIKGLDQLSNLLVLYAWGNQITDFSGLDSNQVLQRMVVYDNPFENLPYIYNKANLNNVDIHTARLTFEDIIPLLEKNPSATVKYAPQSEVFMPNVSARLGEDLTLEYPITPAIDGSDYSWLKSGSLLDSTIATTYSISSVSDSDKGSYKLRITHPNAPSLTLNSNTFTVDILPCIEFELPQVDIIQEDCSKGYTIDLANASIEGGTEPFSFIVNDGIKQTKFNEDILQNIVAGNHQLTIVDANKCAASVNLELPRILGCDPVLSPNNDGIMDVYFIEQPGKVNIFDFNRKLVNTLQAPVSWDGTDMNGLLLDAGLYIILTENHPPINITLIR